MTLVGLLLAGCGGGDVSLNSQPTGASTPPTNGTSTQPSVTNTTNCQLSLNPVLNGPNVTDFKTFWACQEFDAPTQTTNSYGLSVFADGSGIVFDASGINNLHTFLWTQKTCSEIVVEDIYGIEKITEISGAATSGIYNFKTADGSTSSCLLIDLPPQTPKPSVEPSFQAGFVAIANPSEIPQDAFVMGWDLSGQVNSNTGYTVYLGKITNNKFDPDSICNPFGTYGSPYSATSMFNQSSIYASQTSTYSLNNPAAKAPPVIVDSRIYDPTRTTFSPGLIGEITINSTKFPNHVTLKELTDFLGCTR
jgi:hypothetical protein